MILLLGSTGFIGSNLIKLLQNIDKEFAVIDRSLQIKFFSGNSKEKKFNTNITEISDRKVTVINLAGSALGSKEQIYDSNVTFPLRILSEILSPDLNEIVWVQASSYFQNYFKTFGVHKDYYSQCKNEILEELTSLDLQSTFFLRNLILPHIIGFNEPKHRLIPLLLKAKINKENIQLSSGKTIIPILDVQTLVNQIYETSVCEVIGKVNSISPLQILSVEEIAKVILGVDIDLATFGGIPNRPNEFRDESSLLLPPAFGSEDSLRKILSQMEVSITSNNRLGNKKDI